MNEVVTREAVSSREWEQIHEKSANQSRGWDVEFEEVCMRKSVKLWWEHTDITAGQDKVHLIHYDHTKLH